MHCSEVKQCLDQDAETRALESDPPSELPEVKAHLQACESCRDYARELQLTRLLASEPVPAMRNGFADQALARAWEARHHTEQPTHRHSRYRWAGLAASLVLGTLLISQWLIHPTVTVSPVETVQVQVAPAVTREVQIRLVSKEALPDATITIQLEGDIALTGYAGMQTLSWQTSLAAGSNQMALPVTLKGNNSAGGTVIVEVRSGDATKQMRFSVQPELHVAAVYSSYLASI